MACVDPQIGSIIAPITSARAVFVKYDAHLADAADRRRMTQAFFQPTAHPQTRAKYVARFGVTRALLVRPTKDALDSFARDYGSPLVANRAFALFDTSRTP